MEKRISSRFFVSWISTSQDCQRLAWTKMQMPKELLSNKQSCAVFLSMTSSETWFFFISLSVNGLHPPPIPFYLNEVEQNRERKVGCKCSYVNNNNNNKNLQNKRQKLTIPHHTMHVLVLVHAKMVNIKIFIILIMKSQCSFRLLFIVASFILQSSLCRVKRLALDAKKTTLPSV